MSGLRVTVEAPVRPSEDAEKVKHAMLNLFPDLRFEQTEHRLIGRTDNAGLFASHLKRQRIRDAARGMMMRGRRGQSLTIFRVNKQAAYVGKVSFSETESPLGDLVISFEDEALELVIADLAPDTRRPSERGPAPGMKPQQNGGRRGFKTVVERIDWKKEIKGFEEE
jgi:predicted RNA binding protein with dsRBD fold (UPF0201 family)